MPEPRNDTKLARKLTLARAELTEAGLSRWRSSVFDGLCRRAGLPVPPILYWSFVGVMLYGALAFWLLYSLACVILFAIGMDLPYEGMSLAENCIRAWVPSLIFGVLGAMLIKVVRIRHGLSKWRDFDESAANTNDS